MLDTATAQTLWTLADSSLTSREEACFQEAGAVMLESSRALKVLGLLVELWARSAGSTASMPAAVAPTCMRCTINLLLVERRWAPSVQGVRPAGLQGHSWEGLAPAEQH